MLTELSLKIKISHIKQRKNNNFEFVGACEGAGRFAVNYFKMRLILPKSNA